MQHPYLPRRRAGSNDRSAKARQDAEALFRPSVQAAEASRAVVILKKRRSIPTLAAEQAGPQETPAEGLRAPRVHRVEPKGDEAAGASAEVPAEVLAEPASPLQMGAAPLSSPVRRRRRLHGPVSIVRPASGAMTASPAQVSEQASAEGAAALAERGAAGFELDLSAPGRYAALMARIAELQAEADRLRKQEALKAIQWIQLAIRDYGLTRQDLGFS